MLLISLLQTLDYPEIYVSFKRPQLDQLDLCSIAARSSTDQIGLRSDITRVKVGKIGYISGTDLVNNFNPTKLDRYTNASPSTRYLTWQIHDRSSNSSRWDWLLDCFWHVKNYRTGSPSDADQERPSRYIPITRIDRARPIPDCLIELIESAVGT